MQTQYSGQWYLESLDFELIQKIHRICLLKYEKITIVEKLLH